MKILLHDPYGGKFTTDMQEWWTNQGHEVERQTYYNPQLANEWADVIYFFTCDNNLLSATNPDQALLADDANYKPWSLHDMDLSNKKIIVHPVDIEVWLGHFAYDNMWDVVDDVIFPAPHIQKIMMADSRPQAGDFTQHVIPFGVNLDKWTFKEREKGFNIGVVAERWVSKGVDYVIQIALRLKDIDSRYQIYWLGKNNDYHWEHEYFLDFIKRRELPIILQEDFVEDLDAWWEGKNFVLHCAHKETFTYAVAEAMAKGIKPVFHRYLGADKTWPGLTWDSIDEAINLITEDAYDSSSYRQYLIDNKLTLEDMMTSIDKIIRS